MPNYSPLGPGLDDDALSQRITSLLLITGALDVREMIIRDRSLLPEAELLVADLRKAGGWDAVAAALEDRVRVSRDRLGAEPGSPASA